MFAKALKSRYKDLLIISAACAGALFVYLGTAPYGIGLSPDSASYISSARNLLAGTGYRTFSGLYVAWPPLYPTLLAIVGALCGIDPMTGALYLNAVLFALIIFCSGRWLEQKTGSPLLLGLGLALALFAKPLYTVSVYAWSETLFILLSLLFLKQLEAAAATPDTRSCLLLAFYGALACLSRYIGVALILTAALYLGLLTDKKYSSSLYKTLTLTIILSLLPLALWLTRNYYHTGVLFGPRPHTTATAGEVFWNIKTTLSRWFMPEHISIKVRLWGLVLLWAAPACLFYHGISRGQIRPTLALIGGPFMFCVIYLGILFLSATTVVLEPIGSRLLAPLYIPFIIISCGASGYLFRLLERPRALRPLQGITLFLFSASLPFLAKTAWKRMASAQERGLGAYSQKQWENSPLLARLRTTPPEGAVYSNLPDLLYLFTGINAAYSPVRTAYHSPDTGKRGLKDFKKSIGLKENTYLVWFKGGSRTYLYDMSGLRERFRLKTVADFPEGAVYLVTLKDAANTWNG